MRSCQRISCQRLHCWQQGNSICLNLYDEGQAYTEQEYQDWLIEAGFEDFDRVTLPTGYSIVKARKSV